MENTSKLSWEGTYKAMGQEQEDWDEFDHTLLDGLEDDDEDISPFIKNKIENTGE